MDSYLVAQAGSKSGLTIRSLRVCNSLAELSVALADHGFPGRGNVYNARFPYLTRVYRVFPDKAPKKLKEHDVLQILGLIGEKVPVPQTTPKQSVPLTYGRLQQMADGSSVWVRYDCPSTGVPIINERMTIKRSYSQSTKERPVWKLHSTVDPTYWEYFVQDPVAQCNDSQCIDEEKMALFEIRNV